MTSYEWLVTYFGTVDSGSVVVPLDVNLPAEDVCDLIVRSDSTVLVYDEPEKTWRLWQASAAHSFG